MADHFDLTDSQQDALLEFVDAGGGSVDRVGRMRIKGECSWRPPETWVRLAAKGMIVADRNDLMIASNSGLAIAADIRRLRGT